MPENKKKYTGAWCPSITPFDADGKLDLAALEKHFSRLSEAGTDGVLLMGSIGEFTALSMDERVSLIHAARTMTHLPLIANVSGTCMEDMTRLADAAYSEGYEAVMALPHSISPRPRASLRRISIRWAGVSRASGSSTISRRARGATWTRP